MAKHTKEELAAFTSGDDRMLWAAYRDTRQVFYLDHGEADSVRATILKDLVCVVPQCPSPAVTVVAYRAGRRQCFRHKVAVAGAEHAMGVFHIHGQAEIEKWLTGKYERSTVAREVPINATRDRIADVMITGPGGARVSFEVQYASMTAEHWEDRHTDYVAAGIPDVWLFGHAGSQLSLDRESCVRLNGAHRAVANQRLHLLWFNPLELMLATVTVPRYFPHSDRTVHVPVHGAATIDSTLPAATLHLFPLSDATVTANGLTAPFLRELDKCLDEAIALEAEAVEEARARAAREAEQLQKLAAEEARRRAGRDAKIARVKKKHDERLKVWSEHPLRQSVLEQNAGDWPNYLDVPPRGEGAHYGLAIATPYPHQQWQAMLFTKFIQGKNDGTTVTIKECTAGFGALDTDNPLAKEAVTHWFHRLLEFGVLRRVPITWGNGTEGVRYLTSTPTAPQHEDNAENELAVRRAADQLAARGAERERDKHDATARRENDRQASEARKAATTEWESGLMSLSELIATSTLTNAIPPEFQNIGWCPDCRKGIFGQPNIARGYHFYCADFVYSTFGRMLPPKPQA